MSNFLIRNDQEATVYDLNRNETAVHDLRTLIAMGMNPADQLTSNTELTVSYEFNLSEDKASIEIVRCVTYKAYAKTRRWLLHDEIVAVLPLADVPAAVSSMVTSVSR